MTDVNEFGQPVGILIPARTYEYPKLHVMEGTYCRLEPLDPERHAKDLFEVLYGPTANPANFTYLPTSLFPTMEAFMKYLKEIQKSRDPLFFTVISKKLNKAVGTTSILAIDPVNGAAEIGWVTFSDILQRTPVSTEAHYLLATYIMDELHYRRLFWKCHWLNAKSFRAAQRLGFKYEGTFRNFRVMKKRNWDMSYLSITDTEWPEIRGNLVKWLSPSNFDENGKQKTALQARAAQAKAKL